MTARHAAYLEALGIQAWVRKGLVARSGADVPAGLRLGPGAGRLLLLCADAEQTAGRLAADVARALPDEPVWAWPAPEGPGASVAEAVDEHMFTTLLVLGPDTARRVFGKNVPGWVGSARVLVAPGMAALATDPQARRSLWRTICAKRLVCTP
jgi:DNA polymerase III psi subunit